MAPKKAKGKKAEKKTLERLKLSEAEVAEAKKMLEDKDAKRRANSNMMYWLKTQNKRDAYDEATPAERKQFANHWFAWSLHQGTAEQTSKRSVGNEKVQKDISRWWSKHKIIETYGQDKGQAKINMYDKDAKKHRPDRDTGLDGEWHRECHALEDEAEDKHYDGTQHDLNISKDLSTEQEKAEAAADMSAIGLDADSAKSVAEGSGSASSGAAKHVKVKVEGQKPDEDLKTFESIKTKPKNVLRSVSDAITELKRMFEVCNDDSHRKKYTEPLHGDITKLLPKLKADFVNVERVLLSLNRSKPTPDTDILACARKVDKNIEQMNELTDWFIKLCPKKKQQDKEGK